MQLGVETERFLEYCLTCSASTALFHAVAEMQFLKKRLRVAAMFFSVTFKLDMHRSEFGATEVLSNYRDIVLQ